MRTKARPRFYNSIRWRIVLPYLVITALAFLAVSFGVSQIVNTFLIQQRREEQKREVVALSQMAAPLIASSDADALYRMALLQGQRLQGRVYVLDRDGIVQTDGFSKHNGYRLQYREIVSVLWGGKDFDYGFHRLNRAQPGDKQLFLDAPEKYWVVYYASSVVLGGEVIGAVVFSTSIQDVQDSVAMIGQQTTTVLVGTLFVLIVVIFLVARFITQPIVTLTQVIRHMARGNFSQRVAISGQSELAQLGEAFNAMSERLEHTDRLRSEFVSNASHELKTPLSTIKILTETVLYQGEGNWEMAHEFLSDINKEIDRLNAIITDLLRLVKIDQLEDSLDKREMSLDALVEETALRLKPIAESKGLSLLVQPQPVTLLGDYSKLGQAVYNLLDNAIKYTVEGEVGVSCGVGDGMGVVKVWDTGPGIPEKDLDHIFERFYRVDKARARETGGTGLGLSIVERIAMLHGGNIAVESKEGKGTTFIMRLPIEEEN